MSGGSHSRTSFLPSCFMLSLGGGGLTEESQFKNDMFKSMVYAMCSVQKNIM